MRASGSQRPPVPPAFASARIALVLLALGVAIAAGCSGSKNGSAKGSEGSSSSSATSTPAATPPAETTASAPPSAPGAGGSSGSPVSAADLGAQVFATRCALCHGRDGHGDGPGAKGLKPPPRNFHDAAYMNSRTDAQLLETIHKGKGAMPRWQGVLTEAEMTAVLAHIRTFAKKP